MQGDERKKGKEEERLNLKRNKSYRSRGFTAPATLPGSVIAPASLETSRKSDRIMNKNEKKYIPGSTFKYLFRAFQKHWCGT